MKTLKKNNAFTLVELIVVIAIIGILSAVLIPNISSWVSKAKDSAALQEADTLKTAFTIWTTEREELTLEQGKEDFLLYLELGDLIIRDAKMAPMETNSYETGFYFQASNERYIKALYNTTLKQMTLIIINDLPVPNPIFDLAYGVHVFSPAP